MDIELEVGAAPEMDDGLGPAEPVDEIDPGNLG